VLINLELSLTTAIAYIPLWRVLFVVRLVPSSILVARLLVRVLLRKDHRGFGLIAGVLGWGLVMLTMVLVPVVLVLVILDHHSVIVPFFCYLISLVFHLVKHIFQFSDSVLVWDHV
jgi:hypothetical protein